MTFGKHIFTRKARQFVTTARYDNNTLGLMVRYTSTRPMLALLLCTAQGRTITPTTPRPPQGEEMFGALTLKDVPRSLIITAFQLDNGRGT